MGQKYHCVKSVRIRSYSGPHFPTFGLNTERYSVSLFIQSNCGKMRSRITSNTDSFCPASKYILQDKITVLFSTFNSEPINLLQKQQPEVFHKRDVPENSAIFTGKHLCWSVFLIKLQI